MIKAYYTDEVFRNVSKLHIESAYRTACRVSNGVIKIYAKFASNSVSVLIPPRYKTVAAMLTLKVVYAF